MDTNVLERLEKLEGQLRRWKAVTLLLVVVLTLVLLTATTFANSDGLIQTPAARLSANSFVLVGRDGNIYGRFSMRSDKPKLELYDESGKVVWAAPPENTVKPASPKLIYPESH